MCGAHRRSRCDLDHSCRRRASRPCCLAKNRLTCPCQAHNAKNRRRKAARSRARSTRGADRSPDPTGTSAHRNTSTRACPRSLPSSAWSGVALPYCRLPEKGTKLVTWGAAMIKKKTMIDVDKAPAQGYPALPVAPRRALPISRAGGRPKGGGRGRH